MTDTGKRSLTARVLARHIVPAPRPPVTVVQAIPKSERSELAVELATEAGADDRRLAGGPVRRPLGRRPRGQGSAPMARGRAVGRPAVPAAHIPTITGPMSTGALATWPHGSPTVRRCWRYTSRPIDRWRSVLLGSRSRSSW